MRIWKAGCFAAGLALALPNAAFAYSDASGFAGSSAATATQDRQARHREYPAQVRIDPRLIVDVVLKVNARIVNLRDLYIGRPVEAGEVLAEFESAELETIQRSYAETFVNLEIVKAFSTTAEEKLIEGQTGLRWRGLSDADIRKLEESRQPVRNLRIAAPLSGHLLAIGVAEGQVINPGAQSGLFSLSGTTLFRVADSEAVLIEAELPLAAAQRLQTGGSAWLHLPGSAAPVEATVEEVLPIMDGTGLRCTVRLQPLASAGLLGLRDGLRLTLSLEEGTGAAHAH